MKSIRHLVDVERISEEQEVLQWRVLVPWSEGFLVPATNYWSKKVTALSLF